MAPLLRFADAVDRLSARLGAGVAWLVLVMVIVGAGNAVARYAGRFVGMNLTSNGWLELQWYLFGLVVLFAAPDVLRRDGHVRVDLAYGRLGPRGRAAVDLAGTLLFLLPFCVFGVVVAWAPVSASVAVWEGSPDPGGLPRWPIKAAVLVGFALLGLQALAEAVRRGATIRAGGDAP